MVPVALVGGVGAVAEAVPPVASVPYQVSVAPLTAVAINGVAGAPWHTVTELVPGAGVEVTITFISARGLSQPPTT
ncbi:hypothetical protein GCM10027347_03040 [Larkinella harenae]